MINLSEIKTGDIGIESNDTYLGKKIKRVTNSIATHAYIFIWMHGELYISEYLEGKGHKIKKSKYRLKEGNLIAILRNEKEKKKDKYYLATEWFGGKYDMKENLLILLKLKASSFLNFFSIKIQNLDNPFAHNCSRYASIVNGLNQKRLWTPSDLLKSKELKKVYRNFK